MDTLLRTNALLMCAVLFCARTTRVGHVVPTVPANAMLPVKQAPKNVCDCGVDVERGCTTPADMYKCIGREGGSSM